MTVGDGKNFDPSGKIYIAFAEYHKSFTRLQTEYVYLWNCCFKKEDLNDFYACFYTVYGEFDR
jgi:hypothetical protein